MQGDWLARIAGIDGAPQGQADAEVSLSPRRSAPTRAAARIGAMPPQRPATLVELFEAGAREHGARPAIHHAGATLSYAALDAAAQALAAWLQADGVARGDRIALMLPNRPAYAAAALAAWRLGAIVVPIDPQLGGPALRQRLEDAGARTVVLAEDGVAAFESVRETIAPRRVLTAARGDLAGRWRGALLNRWTRGQPRVPRPPDAVRLAEAVARGRRLALQPVPVRADDIALLQYTGGTTGPARGVVLLHRQLVANVEQCALWLGPVFARVPPGEPVQALCALPLHQLFGLTLGLLLGLRLGASAVLADGSDPRALGAALARRRVHLLAGTPALFDALLSLPGVERIDWSGLVLALGGGTALPHATARRWFERTGCAIVEGYGLAEAGPAVSCSLPAVRGEWRAPGDVGLPLPGTELQLRDDEGAPVDAGQVGEVVLRGPQVMAGYWQRPEETVRVMTADGFLRTGDMGLLDDRGHLRLLERKKDLIRVGGIGVAPSEVESVLARLPGVRECAVIGVPDPQAGEAIKAVLVRVDAANPQPSEADVHAHCEIHLPGHQRPRWVEFRDALPKTALGAPLRRALRA